VGRYEIDHPTTDPALPSFVHPTLAEIEEDLAFVFDAWELLHGRKEAYLPQEPEEPNPAYQARVDRAVWTDFFGAALRGFAGVMARFELAEPPESLRLNQSNIDRQGNSIHAFFLSADQMVLRDGGVPILVEMPEQPGPTQAEALQAGSHHPYLVLHPRRMMLNWRTGIRNGAEYVRQAGFLEWHEDDDGGDDGYGVSYRAFYRIITPGMWKLVEIVTTSSGLTVQPALDADGNPMEGFYLDHRQRPLEYVPVIWYSACREAFGEGRLPMLHQALLNLQHFRKSSDYEEKDHKVNMPVPVEKGGLPPAPGEKRRTEAIGPNTLRRVSVGGDFFFAEPNASSLKETRAGIEAIEAHMRENSMSFMYGPGANKTAAQVGMEAAQTQASITTLREQKENVIQQIMRIWCDYTGETLSADAGISMSSALFDQPLTAQDQDQLAKRVDMGLQSRMTAIEELQRAGIIRATASAKDELARLRKELREQMAAARDAMPPPVPAEEDDELPSSGDAAGLMTAGGAGGGGADPEGS
jgi:hypothetical protein